MKSVMRNRIFLNLFLILVLLFSISYISALSGATGSNITIITPAVSGTLTGATSLINASLVAGYEGENYTTANVYLKSSSTANSSWTLIKTYKNYTAVNIFNATFDSRIVEDSNDYIINFTLWNGSTYIGATRSGITVDNTIPQVSSLVPTSSSSNSVTLSSTVTNRNTTGCTLYFSGINPGLSSYTMTYSGTNCSYALTNVPEQTYKWYVRASDGTNTTDSAVQTTNLDVKTSAGKSALLVAEGKATSKGGALLSVVQGGIFSNPTLLWIILGIVGFAIVIIIFAVRRKRR